jgi:hypothetical protein
MTKNYSVSEVVKTIAIEVNKDTGSGNIHFEFIVTILKLPGEEYAVRAYRNETLEVKTLRGVICHDDVLVRDLFLTGDPLRFGSEAEAAGHVTKRLDEVFG